MSDMGNLLDMAQSDEITSQLYPLVELAEVMVRKYDVVVTNPPYMGSSGMSGKLSEYVKEHYPNSKDNRYIAMINMHSWMFLSSFLKLRTAFNAQYEIIVLAQLGPHAFDEMNGEVVQTVAFVARKGQMSSYSMTCDRLVSYNSSSEKEKALLCCTNRMISKKKNFDMIPGKPYAYWISENALRSFENSNLGSCAEIVSGMTTGNNEVYLRAWTELQFSSIAFDRKSLADIDLSETKWIPYHKGGEMRKWYGNHEYVVNWSRSSEFNRAKTTMTHVYLQPCVTWSDISGTSFAGRYCNGGFMFDVKGSCAFADKDTLVQLLGVFNSKITPVYIEALNPTTTTQVGDLKRIPFIVTDETTRESISQLVKQCVISSEIDWNSSELSWGFKRNALI